MNVAPYLAERLQHFPATLGQGLNFISAQYIDAIIYLSTDTKTTPHGATHTCCGRARSCGQSFRKILAEKTDWTGSASDTLQTPTDTDEGRAGQSAQVLTLLTWFYITSFATYLI
ncbi:hypothetical protein J6590_096982 [Homalodisca vitripennis]|nr:hypothetical protein J6590_096982 [Homalodisca vitripennis]